jgi:hypothetical protein
LGFLVLKTNHLATQPTTPDPIEDSCHADTRHNTDEIDWGSWFLASFKFTPFPMSENYFLCCVPMILFLYKKCFYHLVADALPFYFETCINPSVEYAKIDLEENKKLLKHGYGCFVPELLKMEIYMLTNTRI